MYCDQIGKPLATEIATDIAASYTQFIHGGLGFGDLAPNSEQFPALFRYTFPEVIASNRGVRNAEGEFAKKLRNCLVYGIRFDAELYVCRRTIDAAPAYADVIGRCCKKMKKYGEFYFDGRFTVRDTSPLPAGVVRGEFLNNPPASYAASSSTKTARSSSRSSTTPARNPPSSTASPFPPATSPSP